MVIVVKFFASDQNPDRRQIARSIRSLEVAFHPSSLAFVLSLEVFHLSLEVFHLSLVVFHLSLLAFSPFLLVFLLSLVVAVLLSFLFLVAFLKCVMKYMTGIVRKKDALLFFGL